MNVKTDLRAGKHGADDIIPEVEVHHHKRKGRR